MGEANKPRDVELLRRMAGGDEAAFAQLYERHQPGLYRFALHMTGRAECAADAVQETFITLMRQADKFNEWQGTPAAFLFGIARNHVRKAFEKECRYVSLPDEGAVTGNGHPRAAPSHRADEFVEELVRGEHVQRLREAILLLPVHYREALTLCDLQGKSYAEAAALLGCPVGTVRSRLNRARDLLMERLRPAACSEKRMARSGGHR